jgi:hypothetical protein
MLRRSQQQTITFSAIDAVSWPSRKTGITFSVGDVKVSKDGAALANTTNPPVELSLGVYALTLTAAELDCGWLHVAIRNAAMQPVDISGVTSGNPSGVVVDDAANSATTFVTSLTETADDHWAGAGLVFTSGPLRGQVREIASYDGTTKAITLVEPLTAEPTAGDAFGLINL